MTVVSITINNIQVRARMGITILEAAIDAGIDIPHGCFVPEADPPIQECKLCCVEVNGHIVYACSEPVADHMTIETNTIAVENLRRRRIQFPG